MELRRRTQGSAELRSRMGLVNRRGSWEEMEGMRRRRRGNGNSLR